jgi:hypothetical protein
MGTALEVGLLTAPLALVREPLRLTLRACEFGLSSAAEATRAGLELLDPNRGAPPPDFAQHRAPGDREPGDNGRPPDVEVAPDVEPGGSAEPEVVLPETGYLAPEPGEVGPQPDVLDVEATPTASAPEAGADAPPAVPDELIPDHVDEEPVLVAEAAEEGAEEGAGAELHVEPPWEGYDRMTAADIRDRLAAATATEAAAVELYESSRKNRRSVLEAAERAVRG